MTVVGSKFKVRDTDTLYTLTDLVGDKYHLSWTNSSGEFRKDTWDRFDADELFRTGVWWFVDKSVEPLSKQEAEHTGGSVNYYKVHVAHPTTLPEAYDAEANDIIESLGLTFAEGNLFKAIWRMAADRNGKKKKGNNSVYDAEKLVFFAERVLVQEKAKRDESK